MYTYTRGQRSRRGDAQGAGRGFEEAYKRLAALGTHKDCRRIRTGGPLGNRTSPQLPERFMLVGFKNEKLSIHRKTLDESRSAR